jgi:hypothetical protein
LFFAGLPTWGQTGINPFDLTPRLPASASASAVEKFASKESGNPFDVIHPVQPVSTSPRVRVTKQRPTLSEEEQYKTFIFAVSVATLTLLTIFLTIFRSIFIRAWRCLLNENMLSQIFRESQTSGAFPYYILYVFFGVTSGTFLFLVSRHYQLPLPWGNWLSLGIAIAGVWALLAGKHILLSYVGAVFPVGKEIGFYRFTLLIFGILLGLVLVVANLIIAYGPATITQGTIYASFGIIAITYAFRSLRGLLVANNFLATNKFHFFLYLCTVELAPLLIMIKWIRNQI